MPSSTSIPVSGGTLTVTTDGVNFIRANEHEQKLLSDITKAVKEFERKAETANGATVQA